MSFDSNMLKNESIKCRNCKKIINYKAREEIIYKNYQVYKVEIIEEVGDVIYRQTI